MILIHKKKKKIAKNGGFLLLFAVLLASVILAVALSISDTALKEISLSSSAKESNYAFLAADTGAECALYFDRSGSAVFDTTQVQNYQSYLSTLSPAPQCAGYSNGLPITASSPSAKVFDFDFYVPFLGPDNKSCSLVTVKKDESTTPTTTTIRSLGYNTGDAMCSNASLSGRVERAIEVTY